MANFYSEVVEWWEKDKWSLGETKFLLARLSPLIDVHKVSTQKWEIIEKIEHKMLPYFFERNIQTDHPEADEQGFYPIERRPEECTALAYDEGIDVPDVLRNLYTITANKELTYSPNSRVRAEFKKWAEMPCWSSTEAIMLLDGRLPDSRLCVDYCVDYKAYDLDISDIMRRAVITGQLKIVAGTDKDDPMLVPKDVIKWSEMQKISLPELLASAFNNKTISTAKAEENCEKWLRSEVEKSPDKKPHRKKHYKDSAMDKFEVSERGFNRAWGNCTKNTKWQDPGSPQKSKK